MDSRSYQWAKFGRWTSWEFRYTHTFFIPPSFSWDLFPLSQSLGICSHPRHPGGGGESQGRSHMTYTQARFCSEGTWKSPPVDGRNGPTSWVLIEKNPAIVRENLPSTLNLCWISESSIIIGFQTIVYIYIYPQALWRGIPKVGIDLHSWKSYVHYKVRPPTSYN